jgi:hypothetical protein
MRESQGGVTVGVGAVCGSYACVLGSRWCGAVAVRAVGVQLVWRGAMLCCASRGGVRVCPCVDTNPRALRLIQRVGKRVISVVGGQLAPLPSLRLKYGRFRGVERRARAQASSAHPSEEIVLSAAKRGVWVLVRGCECSGGSLLSFPSHSPPLPGCVVILMVDWEVTCRGPVTPVLCPSALQEQHHNPPPSCLLYT